MSQEFQFQEQFQDQVLEEQQDVVCPQPLQLQVFHQDFKDQYVVLVVQQQVLWLLKEEQLQLLVEELHQDSWDLLLE